MTADWSAGRLPAARAASAIAAVARAMAPRATFAWDSECIVDKHGIGQLPGHRSTPIVVAIVTAAGATMPHLGLPTATGATGTIDVMATLTSTFLDPATVRKVVASQGGCIASAVEAGTMARVGMPGRAGSGPVRMGEMSAVAHVLARRLAAGVRHLLVDVTVGADAAGVDDATFHRLKTLFERAGQELSIQVRVTRSAGSQPVGLGFGPSPEARDVLAVLRGAAAAPVALRMHSLNEAGHLLELCGRSRLGHGERDAWRLLDSGEALTRFEAICHAQGGWFEPPGAALSHVVLADRAGHVKSIDAVALGRLARLAGAPTAPAAGLTLRVRAGDRVVGGQLLFTLHAEEAQRLEAVRAALAHATPLRVEIPAPKAIGGTPS